MTVSEFSNSFDTMLNSYASKAVFGDQASNTEIVLDEYEKSVLLTQAQDNVIKSYFERHTNELAQGFDDSSRRQVDFSSLIKTATLDPEENPANHQFDNRGKIYKLPTVMADDGSEYSRVLYILNEALIGYTGSNATTFVFGEGSTATTRMALNITNNANKILQVSVITDPKITDGTCTALFTPASGSKYDRLVVTIGNNTSVQAIKTAITTPLSGTDFAVSDTAGQGTNISGQGVPAITTVRQLSATLMPKNFITNSTNEIRYVIIPINYKEYDREMSKPYAQPLKKQAWRLFQNISTGYDIYSELIPIWNVDTTNLVYKIRYVERPNPIVLVDLPGNLTIDGFNKVSPCDLNPIIHPEILKEAVRLAIESRASAVARAEAYRDADQRRNR